MSSLSTEGVRHAVCKFQYKRQWVGDRFRRQTKQKFQSILKK